MLQSVYTLCKFPEQENTCFNVASDSKRLEMKYMDCFKHTVPKKY